MKERFKRLMKDKTAIIAAAVLVAALLFAGGMMLFGGSIAVAFTSETMQVQSSFMGGIEVPYGEIDSVTLRSDLELGRKEEGFHTPKLTLGVYENEEFGYYNIYAYTNADTYVVLTSGQKTLVLSLQNAELTQVLYGQLLDRLAD